MKQPPKIRDTIFNAAALQHQSPNSSAQTPCYLSEIKPKRTKPNPLDYRPYVKAEVDAGQLTQDQADEFLKALFTIMERFVLDGRDFTPVSKWIDSFQKAAAPNASVVRLKSSNTNKTNGGTQ